MQLGSRTAIAALDESFFRFVPDDASQVAALQAGDGDLGTFFAYSDVPDLEAAGIKPIIENRSLWKEDFERMLPGHDGSSNVVYDESGTVYCYDKSSDPPVRHRMAYLGCEPSRRTLKYRCPARHEGWSCPHDAVCNEGKEYGRTVRVKCETDLRRFPPIPRATIARKRLENWDWATRATARRRVLPCSTQLGLAPPPPSQTCWLQGRIRTGATREAGRRL